MMLFYWFVQAAAASAVCEATVQSEWSGDRYSVVADVQAGEGSVPCRTMVLGSVLEWTPKTLKVVVRQWDDTRDRFGLERLYPQDGVWVLHVPELRTGDRLHVDLTGVRSQNGQSGPSGAGHILRREASVEWRVNREPIFGPGGTVSQQVSLVQTESATRGSHHFWWPAGVSHTGCEASVDGKAAVVRNHEFGCSTDVEAENSELIWAMRWEVPGAASAEEWMLNDGDVLHVRGGEFVSVGLSPTQTDRGLEFRGPGRVGVRLNKLGDHLIESNALEEVQYAAIAVSIPEPGLGLEFKGYRGDATVFPVVLQKIRSQMVVGTLPDSHPLKPRKLTKARRSRWATPWEQALVLTRYLQQLKIPANAYPVRPALMGATVDAPLGYVGAVVRAETSEGAVWLDPSCAVCAVGELSPSLWGGQVFDVDLTQLPPAPEGSLETNHDDDTLRVTLSGLPALEIRRYLAQFPVAARSKKVAEQYGGLGARLVKHEGLTELGAPISLEISVQSRR